jgi:vacuolar-type H+-ATPase subunit C/Vma6
VISQLGHYAAVNARVRTLLAGLLGRSGLDALYTYPTRAAMLQALARSAYGGALAAAARPETGLRGRFVQNAISLLVLLKEPEREFLRRYCLWHEVENLKIVIRAVAHRIDRSLVESRLLPLGAIATVDPRALLDATDLNHLAERLGDSAYGPVLAGALGAEGAATPFALEVAVEWDYRERLWEATTALTASDRDSARQLLGVLFDILKLCGIGRFRDVLGLAPSEIVAHLPSRGRWIGAARSHALAEDKASGWQAVLSRTPYADFAFEADGGDFESAIPLAWRRLAAEAQRKLSSYPFEIGVPLSFLLLQEIEIRDLGRMLAAKDMQLPADAVADRIATLRH